MGFGLHSLLEMTDARWGACITEFMYGIPECEGAGDGALISFHETAVNSFSSPDGSARPCRGDGSPFTILIGTGAERVDMSAMRPAASGNVWSCDNVEIADICESGDGGDVDTGVEQWLLGILVMVALLLAPMTDVVSTLSSG
jgi:hypothetical protein